MWCPSDGGDLQGLFAVLPALFRTECFSPVFAVFGCLALCPAVGALGLPPCLVAGIPPVARISSRASRRRRTSRLSRCSLRDGGVHSRELLDLLDPEFLSSLFTESDPLSVEPCSIEPPRPGGGEVLPSRMTEWSGEVGPMLTGCTPPGRPLVAATLVGW